MRKMILILFLALSARAEQKNVKLLTGLTDLELQRTMNMMRASMGTHCDYCHVVTTESGWDWASDEKPRKRRARKMIRMVMDINRDTFGGQPVVSCYTCHRGSVKPVTLAALPQAAPKFPTPRVEEPQLLDAKDVVAKYAAALGDASRLKLPRILKGERTNFQGTAPIELEEEHGKIHVTVRDPRQTLEGFAEGDAAWWLTPTGKQMMQSDEATNFRALAVAYTPVAPSDIGEGAQTIAKEKIGDAEVWVVKGDRQRFYFDTASGLLLRKVLLTPTAIGTLPQQTDYEDYRDAGGTKFPFRVRVSLVDPWAGGVRQYSSVEVRQ